MSNTEMLRSISENEDTEKLYLKNGSKNKALEGLKILAKYSDDVTVTVSHDVLHAWLEEDELEKVTKEDAIELYKWWWAFYWDGDFQMFT